MAVFYIILFLSLSPALWIGSRIGKTVRSLEDRRREEEGPLLLFLLR